MNHQEILQASQYGTRMNEIEKSESDNGMTVFYFTFGWTVSVTDAGISQTNDDFWFPENQVQEQLASECRTANHHYMTADAENKMEALQEVAIVENQIRDVIWR